MGAAVKLLRDRADELRGWIKRYDAEAEKLAAEVIDRRQRAMELAAELADIEANANRLEAEETPA